MTPLIIAALPLLAPVLKGLIGNVQKIFGHSNGTGQVKRDTVVAAVKPILEKLSAAGHLPGVLEGDDLTSLVEVIVQYMKATGDMPQVTAPVIPAIPAAPIGTVLAPSNSSVAGRRYVISVLAEVPTE